MRYVKVEGTNIEVLNTTSFKKVLKETFEEGYDTTDYIFDENLDIRVFIEIRATHKNLEETILRKLDNETVDIFYGTCLFTKCSELSFLSLSKKDVKIIQKRIVNNNGQLEIYY